jgi:hypothetical protein
VKHLLVLRSFSLKGVPLVGQRLHGFCAERISGFKAYLIYRKFYAFSHLYVHV